MSKKPTIPELEDILNSEETTPVKIFPNGEIQSLNQTRANALLRDAMLRGFRSRINQSARRASHRE